MNTTKFVFVFLFVFAVASVAAAGKGFMGGGDGTADVGDDGGAIPIEEPGTDMTTGSLYGDLYVILRYLVDEAKTVPAVNESGEPIMGTGSWTDLSTGIEYTVPQQTTTTAPAVGGEPRLTEEFASYTITDEETGEVIINPLTDNEWWPAPYPSQCLQPVADFERWGDISAKTGIATDFNGDGNNDNLLPLVMTYDPTWERTECEVSPAIFIQGSVEGGETWNGVTYYKDIYYTDLVQEVSFGRLNVGRAPEAVLNHAFDEAIRAINNARSIVLDASGRLLLTTDVYDEFLTNPDGTPVLIETVEKAIDSPLENMALYVKLMKDGHLITPATERSPIDRSVNGGIPQWKYLELEDGPSRELRPIIDIDKVRIFGLGHLVDAPDGDITTYYTFWDAEGDLNVELSCPLETVCEEWHGIVNLAEDAACSGPDFPFSASFLAAAADKTGGFNIDKIVYFNSIMGINKVAGYSEYDDNGEPTDDAVDYSINPVYFNFGTNMNRYERGTTFRQRGQVVVAPAGGNPAEYDGNMRVLVEQSTPGIWAETVLPIFATIFGGIDADGTNITGFTRMADDDLRVIEHIHTYQIPALR
ncbi:MAG: hypothetical protein ACYDBT_11390 [Desulfobulbaceae bacterium]